ncbi:acid phosphatase [Moniliophthora roreri]|nr:acid phosphatase [Moniliophthora roreri]
MQDVRSIKLIPGTSTALGHHCHDSFPIGGPTRVIPYAGSAVRLMRIRTGCATRIFNFEPPSITAADCFMCLIFLSILEKLHTCAHGGAICLLGQGALRRHVRQWMLYVE